MLAPQTTDASKPQPGIATHGASMRASAASGLEGGRRATAIHWLVRPCTTALCA